MCNSVLSMIWNIKQNNNENILNAGCFVHKTLASTQHSCTDGSFSALAWDVIPWTWSSEECFLWDSCQTHLTCKIWKQEMRKQINTLSFLVQYNGGLVTLVMRDTMKLDKIYYDVKSFTIFTSVPLHLEFLGAFGSTETKYTCRKFLCVRALYSWIYRIYVFFFAFFVFLFFFLIAYTIKILTEIYDVKSLLKQKIKREFNLCILMREQRDYIKDWN